MKSYIRSTLPAKIISQAAKLIRNICGARGLERVVPVVVVVVLHLHVVDPDPAAVREEERGQFAGPRDGGAGGAGNVLQLPVAGEV